MGSDRSARAGRDGSFSADVSLSDKKGAGVYYISIWVSRESGSPFVAVTPGETESR